MDTGENRPTDQDFAVFKELAAKLNEILARLGAVVSGDLASFNQVWTR